MHRITLCASKSFICAVSPLEIAFSPWFNTIIGGRGSGKSTLLETLRLALAREVDIRAWHRTRK
ncbi:AAA family ATPase [Burkholderia multivorans]|uniref:AAA family ATPase n=1 Tax=Burkholderia multivorans TaxID=87883 RepID=UPI003BABB35E